MDTRSSKIHHKRKCGSKSQGVRILENFFIDITISFSNQGKYYYFFPCNIKDITYCGRKKHCFPEIYWSKSVCILLIAAFQRLKMWSLDNQHHLTLLQMQILWLHPRLNRKLWAWGPSGASDAAERPKSNKRKEIHRNIINIEILKIMTLKGY